MVIDNDNIVHFHIYLIREETEEYLAGWYFSDEIDRLHGPFGTFEETKELYENYVNHS
jgi:hypothetical protein